MNGQIAKEIKYDLDTVGLYNNDELNKSIIVEVDSGILNHSKNITNELISISVSSFLEWAVENLKDICKYIKKVNFDKPDKRSILGKLTDTPLDMDYSGASYLYDSLKFVPMLYRSVKKSLLRVNEVEKEYQDLIDNYDLNELNSINKTSLLANLEGLKQLKQGLLRLEESYGLLNSNPKINRFLYYWTRYKNENVFPIKCIVNDEIYKLADYNDLLMVDNKNVAIMYEELLKLYNKVKKSIKKPYTYEYLKLKLAYECGTIDKMLARLDKVEGIINKEINESKNEIVDNNTKLVAVKLIRSEFIKLNSDVENIIQNIRTKENKRK